MEYMPDCVLQIIYNYVPHEVYDYMDGLVELFVIADGRDAAGAPATGAGHATRVSAGAHGGRSAAFLISR